MSERIVAKRIEDGDKWSYVLCIDGRRVSGVTVRHDNIVEWINTPLDDDKRKGYASKLLLYVEKIAKERGLRLMCAENILADDSEESKKVRAFFEERCYKLKLNPDGETMDGKKMLDP